MVFVFRNSKGNFFVWKRLDSLVQNWEKGKGPLGILPNYQQPNIGEQHYYIIVETNPSSPIHPIYTDLNIPYCNFIALTPYTFLGPAILLEF